jgi:hypothetical protein
MISRREESARGHVRAHAGMMFVLGLSAACWIAEFGLLEIARDPPRLNRQPKRLAPPS